jgi:hypothetical protein
MVVSAHLDLERLIQDPIPRRYHRRGIELFGKWTVCSWFSTVKEKSAKWREDLRKKLLHRPGIEPGPPPWHGEKGKWLGETFTPDRVKLYPNIILY